jgi:hypothetical protein
VASDGLKMRSGASTAFPTGVKEVGSSSLLVIQGNGCTITLSQRQMVSSKILVNQWRNEPSSREQLGHHLGFTKSDTDGEVSFAGTHALTHLVSRLVPNVNRAYLRLRHQYQK